MSELQSQTALGKLNHVGFCISIWILRQKLKLINNKFKFCIFCNVYADTLTSTIQISKVIFPDNYVVRIIYHVLVIFDIYIYIYMYFISEHILLL